MIRYILPILGFWVAIPSIYSQITLPQSEQSYFQEDLHLHVVSESVVDEESLLDQIIHEHEKGLSENLVDFPYRSELDLSQIKNIANQSVLLEIVKREVASRNFKEAQNILAVINSAELPKDSKTVYHFYKGYLKFVHKDFNMAQQVFDSAESIKTAYKYESIYYSAFCDLFQKEYELAYNSFSQLTNQKNYKKDLPYYMALSKYQLEDYNAVIQILKNALDHSQSIYKDAMRELLSRAYYKESKWEQLSNVLLNDDQCCDTPEQHYFVGLSLFKRGKKEESINHLNAATALGTEEAQNALLALGSIYAEKDPQLAVPMFEEAAQMSYKLELKDQALLSLAKVYQKLHQPSRQMNALDRIRNTSPQYVSALRLKYQSAYQNKMYPEALAIIISHPELKDPELYHELLFRSGLEYYNSNQKDKASDYLQESSQLSSNPSIGLKSIHLLSQIQFEKQDYESLKNTTVLYQEAAAKASHTDPMITADIQYLNAIATEKSGNVKKAIKAYEEAEMAIVAAFKASGSESLELLYEDVILRKADNHMKRGNKKAAHKSYNQAYEQNVTRGDYALYQRGKVEDLQGEPFLQISTYETLEKKYPKSKYVIDANMKKGVVLYELDRSKDAYDEFSKVFQSDLAHTPQKVEALLNLGLITYNQGDLETALSFYKKAIGLKESPENSRNRALLAIEEIYLNDLKDSDGYFAYTASIPDIHTPSLDKDSIDFNIAIQAIKANRKEGQAKLENYIAANTNSEHYPDALKELAKTHEINEDHNSAISTYQKLMAASPVHHQLSLQRIIHNLSKTDRHQEYVDFNQKLLEENYGDEVNQQAYANIAKASTKIKKMAPYEKHISIAFNGKLLNNNEKDQITILLAREYLADQKYDQLKDQISRLVKSENDLIAAEGMLLLSERLVHTHKYNESLQAANKALEKNSQNREFVSKVILVQAEAYIALEDLSTAESALETVLSQSDLNPAILKKADELMESLKRIRKDKLDAQNTTLSLQYSTHE